MLIRAIVLQAARLNGLCSGAIFFCVRVYAWELKDDRSCALLRYPAFTTAFGNCRPLWISRAARALVQMQASRRVSTPAR
jgi:hypothetical protein